LEWTRKDSIGNYKSCYGNQDEEYDDDDDVYAYDMNLSSHKKSLRKEKWLRYKKESIEKKNGGYTIGQLWELNEIIREFVLNNELESFPFAPMNRSKRLQIHRLAAVYALKSHSKGSGKRRFPTLIKTRNSQLAEEDTVSGLIERIAITRKADLREDRSGCILHFRKRPHRNTTNKVVGANASPITEDNIGNRLLRSMGWSPGSGLGANEQGIIEPLNAILKHNKLGLGY